MSIGILGCMVVESAEAPTANRLILGNPLKPVIVDKVAETIEMPECVLALVLYGGELGQDFKLLVTLTYPDETPFPRPVQTYQAQYLGGRFDFQSITLSMTGFRFPFRQPGYHRLSLLVDGEATGTAGFGLVTL